ncbi:MAG TPA: hypothetical protein VJU59_11615 [Paraburkholderia sp.]|uniref:hypothetical protein n=1 Tax=Paraburkholderia sp. TaxID=1926495 RepID=UPI002B4728C1|nr:hypothetical protein [Paraburkholderia sp.]HKR40306.1 hypothetical protein [Paraburkholderia sp.]
MSTKITIQFQEKYGAQPGWHLYEEMLDPDDFVYLELDGVQLDLNVFGRGGSPIGAPPSTVLLRLPTATARQLGLMPHACTTRWSMDSMKNGLEGLQRLGCRQRLEGGAAIELERKLVRVAIAVGAVVYLARMMCSRLERGKAEAAVGAIEGIEWAAMREYLREPAAGITPAEPKVAKWRY